MKNTIAIGEVYGKSDFLSVFVFVFELFCFCLVVFFWLKIQESPRRGFLHRDGWVGTSGGLKQKPGGGGLNNLLLNQGLQWIVMFRGMCIWGILHSGASLVGSMLFLNI